MMLNDDGGESDGSVGRQMESVKVDLLAGLTECCKPALTTEYDLQKKVEGRSLDQH